MEKVIWSFLDLEFERQEEAYEGGISRWEEEFFLTGENSFSEDNAQWDPLFCLKEELEYILSTRAEVAKQRWLSWREEASKKRMSLLKEET